MSLGKNILANYASQFYVTLISIVMVPMYIKYMGAETYGLVGFFAMLQAWFTLLDMGLTPTVARETARHQGGAMSALEYRRLVRALEGIFIAVALVGGAALLLASDYISQHWLKASVLLSSEVASAVKLMAIIIALRWICGLYRGVISGSQRMVWLSGFNAAVASARFVGVMPLLMYVGATPTHFFSFQLGVAFVELVFLCSYAYRLLPSSSVEPSPAWGWAPLRPVIKFSLSIAFTSSVWVLVTQTDKLILSKLLPLAEYGYFTLAVLMASGVMLLSGPVSSAIMPRMAKLEAEGDHQGLIHIYRNATQLVVVICGSATITIVLFAEALLHAWTGDQALARATTPILQLYALGNGILAISAFPYYLQYSKGDLKLHLLGNTVFVVILIPLIIWGTSNYGAMGAGYVWCVMNMIAFFFWLPFIHQKFAPGLNSTWYWNDIFRILVPMLIVAGIIKKLSNGYDSILAQLSAAFIAGLLALFVSIFFAPAIQFGRKTKASFLEIGRGDP
jgi:O-antigen/teichoic acid export membrane protein